jgi:PhzF family phenazine biosynthesis protein
MSPPRLFQVDSFTAAPFAGNPAAVVLLESSRDPAWMRRVARETSMPATAFVVAEGDRFALRWFTRTVELDLCGHGTLAAAHVLWETERLAPDAASSFSTRSGTLTARREGAWIELDFPATAVSPLEAPAGLFEALGVVPRDVYKSRFDCLLELESEHALAALRPDFPRLRGIATRGVIVTSRAADPQWDFVSRFFAPSVGLDEDQVTGSAHCALAPYWSDRLGKATLRARQISERGGELRLGVEGERVRIAGQAVMVVRGEILA